MKAFFISITLLLAVAPLSRAVEVTFERNTNLPLVYINVLGKFGSVQDPAHKEGLTLLAAESLLRGTTKHTKQEIQALLESYGAEIEIDTRAEMTVIRGRTLQSNLDPFLNLLEELVVDSVLTPQEFKKQKEEQQAKVQSMLDQDWQVALLHYNRALFGTHPYGSPIDGTLKSLKTISLEDVLAQKKRILQKGTLTVIGSGDAKEKRISQFAKSLEKRLPNGEAFAKVQPPKPLLSRKVVLVDKPDRTQLQVVLAQIGLLPTDPRYFAFYLANNAYGGGGFTTRLFNQLRKANGWTYSAYSQMMLGQQPRSWTSHISPKNTDLLPSLSKLLQVHQEFLTSGITEEEFLFGKEQITQKEGFLIDTPRKRAENAILEKALGLSKGFMSSYASQISKLKLKQVNAAARAAIPGDGLLILVVGTASIVKKDLAKATQVAEDQIEVIPFDQLDLP